MKLTTALDDGYFNPTDDVLRRMIKETFSRDEDNYVILEDEESGYFIQAIPMSNPYQEHGCRIEYRDLATQQHFAADEVSLEVVISLFQQFNHGDASYRNAIQWHDVSTRIEQAIIQDTETQERISDNKLVMQRGGMIAVAVPRDVDDTEELSYDECVARFQSERHKVLREAVDWVHKQLGITGVVSDSVSNLGNGATNAIVIEYPAEIPSDKVNEAAEMFGTITELTMTAPDDNATS